MRKVFIIAAILVLLTISVARSAAAEAYPTAGEPERQVYAFYYAWWTADSWTNPQLTDHPLALYNVGDPETAARQIEAGRAAGLDGFIVDWLGSDNNNITHQALGLMLDEANQQAFQIGVVVDLNERDYLETPVNLDESMAYLMTQVITQPSYLRIDGKPVIYFWNEERFSLGTWMSLRAQYDPDNTQIWIMEGTNQGYMPTFDGMYMMDIAWANDLNQTFQYWQEHTRLLGAEYFMPTVLPGWDASQYAGWDTTVTPPRDRDNGAYLLTNWNAARSTTTDIILVNSWNGYFENSQVEPSMNFGTQTTDSLRDLIIAWKAL